jgi:hypothetical protein
MERADLLAGKLAAREVDANRVRTLLHTLSRDAGDWTARRTRAQEIAALAPGSWLHLRSRSMRGQLEAVRQELAPLLDGRLAEADVYFVLAWTARLLKVREKGWPPPSGSA